jgi:hypothetical protein
MEDRIADWDVDPLQRLEREFERTPRFIRGFIIVVSLVSIAVIVALMRSVLYGSGPAVNAAFIAVLCPAFILTLLHQRTLNPAGREILRLRRRVAELERRQS